MKVQLFSFYSFILGLGLVVVALCNNVYASQPVSKKIPLKEVRIVKVNLTTQRFDFYEQGRCLFSGPVCTGRKGLETPKGKFRVLMRAKSYFSRKYDGAPMPFAVQFTTGGHFLHLGEIKPKPASHGCVRLNQKDAERIFRSVKIGDSVVITD